MVLDAGATRVPPYSIPDSALARWLLHCAGVLREILPMADDGDALLEDLLAFALDYPLHLTDVAGLNHYSERESQPQVSHRQRHAHARSGVVNGSGVAVEEASCGIPWMLSREIHGCYEKALAMTVRLTKIQAVGQTKY